MRHEKKILIIVLIFAFIALLVGGIFLRKKSIQRQEHIEELMQMELPDIVFSHSYEDRGWNPHYYYKCIIDKNGNVYYTENPDAAYAISHSEGEATFDENWTIIHHVDEIELREQYCIFLELAWILFGKWKESSVSILCLP